MSGDDIKAKRRALAASIKPLTEPEKALLRRVIDEEIASARAGTEKTDDRLACFFGGMIGRAGFDVTVNKLDELWGQP